MMRDALDDAIECSCVLLSRLLTLCALVFVPSFVLLSNAQLWNCLVGNHVTQDTL